MDLHLTWQLLLLMFFAAAIAGFVDTIAGGGGLITVPVLFLVGLPPILALGTNKFQGSFGTLTATATLIRKGQLDARRLALPFAFALGGSVIGTLTVQFVAAGWLDILVPIVLTVIALYFLLAPKAGDVASHPRLARGPYERLVVPVIGFYDGFLGPGTGSFFALAGVALRGLTVIEATTAAKFFNFASNIASLAVFIVLGKVVWLAGLIMMAGQVLGAYAGAHVIINGGARFIRPMIVIMCVAMLARYLWQKGFLPF
jgi:uncharacterized protein